MSDVETTCVALDIVDELPHESDDDDDDNTDGPAPAPPARLVDQLRALAGAYRPLTPDEKLALQIKTITDALIDVAKQGQYYYPYTITTSERFYYPGLAKDVEAHFNNVTGVHAYLCTTGMAGSEWHLLRLSWDEETIKKKNEAAENLIESGAPVREFSPNSDDPH